MKDAIGNDIVIGKTYGYTKHLNGHTLVITGVCTKIGVGKQNKIQLEEIIEREFFRISSGETEPHTVASDGKKRTVASVICFPSENIHKSYKSYKS